MPATCPSGRPSLQNPSKGKPARIIATVAAGGGVFQAENGTKVHLPGANLNDIANQAYDILETMETRPVIPDRKLLARLVLIREEARNMMRGECWMKEMIVVLTHFLSQVNFLTKLVALKPGKTVQDMIKNVMQGKYEGAENSAGEDENAVSSGITGRVSSTTCTCYADITCLKRYCRLLQFNYWYVYRCYL